jgi:hypothetical protein
VLSGKAPGLQHGVEQLLDGRFDLVDVVDADGGPASVGGETVQRPRIEPIVIGVNRTACWLYAERSK